MPLSCNKAWKAAKARKRNVYNYDSTCQKLS